MQRGAITGERGAREEPAASAEKNRKQAVSEGGGERAVRRLPPPGRLGRESKPGGGELPSKDAASEEETYCVSPSL